LSREKPTHTLRVSNVGVVFLGDAKPGKLGVGRCGGKLAAERSGGQLGSRDEIEDW